MLKLYSQNSLIMPKYPKLIHIHANPAYIMDVS